MVAVVAGPGRPVAEQLGDEWAEADGWKMHTAAALVQDDYDLLAEVNGKLLAAARRLGSPFFLGWCHIAHAWSELYGGSLVAARRDCEIALRYDRELGGALSGGIALALLAEIDTATGQYELAGARLAGFLARTPKMGAADRGVYPDSFGVVLAVPTGWRRSWS